DRRPTIPRTAVRLTRPTPGARPGGRAPGEAWAHRSGRSRRRAPARSRPAPGVRAHRPPRPSVLQARLQDACSRPQAPRRAVARRSHPRRRTLSSTTSVERKRDVMPLVQVKVIKGVFDTSQKQEMITQLTETMVGIEGEALRGVTTVLIDEVESGDWG